MKIPPNHHRDIPPAFLERMSALLGEEYPAFVGSLQLPAVTGLRVNTLKVPIDEFCDQSPWNLSPIPWCPSGFLVNNHAKAQSRPGKHPWHAAGLYYLQDPSAMAAAEVLAPQTGEKVLDLAAAPGGKTTHLAALMNNTGVLVANEISLDRVWDLSENLQRCGVTNVVITHSTPTQLADRFGDYFDRVLLDAPCAGEGMFRKAVIARREWSPEHVHSCAFRQAVILDQAAQLVKPKGHLVYCTCSFSPDENEGVIAKFLVQHPEFNLVANRQLPGFSPARPEWVGLPENDRLQWAIRIWPHLAVGEGHFIALLQKNGYTARTNNRSMNRVRPSDIKTSRRVPSRSSLAIFEQFCTNHLNLSFDPARLVLCGTFLYYLPEIVPQLSGLAVIHDGWCLGTIRKQRFTPSHALAMGITSAQACHVFEMEPEDARLAAYFKGELITDPGENAWVLMCVEDYPVGWAKRVQNVLRNYYPHGLRNRM